jgi:hypothetical protein
MGNAVDPPVASSWPRPKLFSSIPKYGMVTRCRRARPPRHSPAHANDGRQARGIGQGMTGLLHFDGEAFTKHGEPAVALRPLDSTPSRRTVLLIHIIPLLMGGFHFNPNPFAVFTKLHGLDNTWGNAMPNI